MRQSSRWTCDQCLNNKKNEDDWSVCTNIVKFLTQKKSVGFCWWFLPRSIKLSYAWDHRSSISDVRTAATKTWHRYLNFQIHCPRKNLQIASQGNGKTKSSSKLILRNPPPLRHRLRPAHPLHLRHHRPAHRYAEQLVGTWRWVPPSHAAARSCTLQCPWRWSGTSPAPWWQTLSVCACQRRRRPKKGGAFFNRVCMSMVPFWDWCL